MSSCSILDKSPINGGDRAIIREMIDRKIVTVEIPHCEGAKFKFLPRKSINLIAEPRHIKAYVLAEADGRWIQAGIEEFVGEINRKARKLFIAVAKNNWTVHLYTDSTTAGGTKFRTSDKFDVKGGLRD